MASMNRLIISLLFIFVFCFPSMANSEFFRSIQLPPTATGPESIAFELATGRFYVGVADGRILQYNGLNGFVEHGFTGRDRSKALCDGVTNPDLGARAEDRSHPSLGWCRGRALPLLQWHRCSPTIWKCLFSDYTTAYDLRLLMYNPSTRRVTVLLRNLSGPAGVAVSQDGSYVLVSNYNANNTIRFWLMGPRADTYDIINIQERPNNIQRTLLGDYWQAAAMVKQETQTLVPIGQRINSFGRVLQTINLERWYGNNLVSEVQEFQGSLYITSICGLYRRLYSLKPSTKLNRNPIQESNLYICNAFLYPEVK
ncbi:putative Minichromosome instability 12-like [Hibiscus syriacus]|uniref:Minichromosome instability 12-like n=1 Tax=Hibiscus syriacus TaxID=106335 RepID=A0A6A2ZAL1_HIBSY|nr:putative Minichromosome instability 12-like [Hibiscus syriacus]